MFPLFSVVIKMMINKVEILIIKINKNCCFFLCISSEKHLLSQKIFLPASIVNDGNDNDDDGGGDDDDGDDNNDNDNNNDDNDN